MKILHISPTYEKATCGIGAYSRHLYTALRGQPEVESQMVLDGLMSVHQSLHELKPDICHLQLEYSFCSPERLTLLDEQCSSAGTKLFITFHTLTQIKHNVAAPSAVKLAHTPFAKHYGQFEVIPSGIPITIPDMEIEKFLSKEEIDFIVGRGCLSSFPQPTLFFGQAHPHKQLWEVLEHFRDHPSNSLVCVVSKPVMGGSSYYDRCYKFAQTLKNVCWISNYLNDEQVLAVSSYCAFAIFPYAEYGSIGVSAAVKLILNNPDIWIRTSNTSHFSDIDPQSGILQKMDTIEAMFAHLNPDQVRDQRFARNAWLDKNRFSAVAKRHIELYSLAHA